MSDAPLLIENRNGLLRLTINRTEKSNALNLATVDEIGAAFARFTADDSIRCAIITGAGDRCFAAGADLQELDSMRSPEEARALSRRGRAALDQIRNFPVPVIAALNGHALGGGAELAVACDLRVSAPQAEIGFVQAQLGVTTAWGGGIDLALTVGDRRAMRILATAARLEASRALDLGLVDWVCAPGQELDVCLATFLEPYLKRSREVLAGFKAPVAAHRRRIHAEIAPTEEEQFVRTWTHPEHWKAVTSMNHRR